MSILIQVLRVYTNNFSEQNIMGKCNFDIVYKEGLHDRTKIAVKIWWIGEEWLSLQLKLKYLVRCDT